MSENKQPSKIKITITSIVVSVIVVGICIYILQEKGVFNFTGNKEVTLQESKDLITLDVNKNCYIGVNGEQIIKASSDGIYSFDFEGKELWSDTYSIPEYIVKQRENYIAIGSKIGYSIIVFDEKGREYEISSEYPIVYFSINEEGRTVVIEQNDTCYTVKVYNELGREVGGQRISYISTDGYPMAAELAPDGKLLLISYLNVSEPQVTSTVFGMDITDDDSEALDNTLFGMKFTDNLVYEIEFMGKEAWVAIGDKQIGWFNLAGEQIGSQTGGALVYSPYVFQMSRYGEGYLPIVASNKPTQNIVHRQDYLSYYNAKGEETFHLDIGKGSSSFYNDANGVIIQTEDDFSGYDKLGNKIFTYTPNIYVTKVIYLSKLKKGIAVNKEKIMLLLPKKEDK